MDRDYSPEDRISDLRASLKDARETRDPRETEQIVAWWKSQGLDNQFQVRAEIARLRKTLED